MLRSSLWFKRLLLIVAGLACSVILIELLLRVAGTALLAQRYLQNRSSLQGKDICTVLCIGESTTFLRYPAFLESLLNQEGRGRRFKVINKGVIGTHTDEILRRLPAYLDTYHPDIVIAMMGINDTNPRTILPGRHAIVPLKNDRWTLRSFRCVKLYEHLRRIITLKLHILGAERRERRYACRAFTPAPVPPAGSAGSRDPSGRGDAPVRAGPGPERRPAIPDKDAFDSWFRQGIGYSGAGQAADAERCFRACIDLDPHSGIPWEELGVVYWHQNRLHDASLSFTRARELGNLSANIPIYLADIYLKTGRTAEAKNLLRNLSLPRFIELRGSIDSFTREERQLLAALLSEDTDDAYSLIHLAGLAATEGNRAQELAHLEAAARLIGINDQLCGAIAIAHLRRGRVEAARSFFQQAEALRMRYVYQQVQNDYVQLARQIAARNATLICMQYPMRSIKPLKKMMASCPGILFVDNEKLFKDAVIREGFDAYFTDAFAGDFGHCSDNGAMLIARNAAAVIFRKCPPLPARASRGR